ncbi:hypothetical protein CWI36_2645p0010, partial [Hamiltosporidium magnivora]
MLKMRSNFRKNSNFGFNAISISLRIFCILISLEFASTNKYFYSFERNENSEILIFAQNKEGLLLNDDIDEKYSFKIFFDVSLEIRAEKKQIFLYENGNDIKFELFDNFLAPNAPENKYKNGKIECDFELLYFLRIAKNMVEFPEILNIHQVKCMLTIMRCLHVVENRNIAKFFQILMFKYFVYSSNNTSRNDCLSFEEIYDFCSFMEIDYYVKKSIILGFLNTLMIESVFYNENLVLLKNIYEKYEVSLFDEHIPYKNLLINNINVFFLLENIFKNTYLLNIFRVLLNSVGIYSLILDNFGKNKIQNKSFKFYIFTITIFKSITISNFRNESFSAFLEELSRFVQKDLEYIRFINLFIPWDILGLFLKSQKPKGLMLSDTSMPMNNHFMDIISDLIKTLEYINFVHVDISFAWWTDFFEKGNAHKIILDFYSIVSQNYFLEAFSDSYSFKDVTYF